MAASAESFGKMMQEVNDAWSESKKIVAKALKELPQVVQNMTEIDGQEPDLCVAWQEDGNGFTISPGICKMMGIPFTGIRMQLKPMTFFGLMDPTRKFFVEAMGESVLRILLKKKELPEGVTLKHAGKPPDYLTFFTYNGVEFAATAEATDEKTAAIILFLAEER